MFFDDWQGLLRVAVVGVLAYAALVVLLRTSGKRALAKLNAFDFVVTIALGSILATILLSQDVALAEGVLAFVVLLALQYLITWLSVRSATVRRLVKSEPALLLLRGRLLEQAMKAERVTIDEILDAVRSHGVGSLEEVEALVLETDGTFSVIRRSDAGDGSAMKRIAGYDSGHR